MKKIVGILAAAAVLATSVFAADLSAKVRLEGSLFDFGADKSISALKIDKPSDQNWNPVLSTSVNADKAGAKFDMYSGAWEQQGGWNKGFDLAITGVQIWYAPFDGFKFIFGNNEFNLNQEHITWSKTSSTNVSDDDRSNGYSVSYNANGFGIDLSLLPGWGNAWMSKADGGDVVIGATNLKVQYGADFGTINALLAAKSTFKDLKIGAGYANNFSGINMFVNFLFFNNSTKGAEASKIRAELFAEGSADAFGWAAFPTFDMDLKAKSDAIAVGLVAQATYNLEGCQLSLYIEDSNFLAKDFAMTIKPGISGNLGGANWKVMAQINAAKKVSFGLPIELDMAW